MTKPSPWIRSGTSVPLASATASVWSPRKASVLSRAGTPSGTTTTCSGLISTRAGPVPHAPGMRPSRVTAPPSLSTVWRISTGPVSRATSRSAGPQLRMPKLRQGSYFPPFLEARKGSEKALVAVIQG